MRECDRRDKVLKRLRHSIRHGWSALEIENRRLEVDLSYLKSAIEVVRRRIVSNQEAPRKKAERRAYALDRYYKTQRDKPRQYDLRAKLASAMRRIDRENSRRLPDLQRAAFRMLRRRRDYAEKRIAKALRRRLEKIVKGYRRKTEDLIGCPVQRLRAHLESQFTGGMSWDNYGLWHIDHVRPCIRFNLKIPEQQRECFRFTNLQPLWAVDNRSKGVK